MVEPILSDDSPFSASPRTMAALAACMLVGAFANAAGVGGGAIFSPIFNALVGFSLKSSTSLSQACIAAGSIMSVAINLSKRHPTAPSQPLIDLSAAVVLTPVLLVGVGIGVLLNVILPSWILTLLLVLSLVFLAYSAIKKGRALWQKENEALHAAAMAIAHASPSLRCYTSALPHAKPSPACMHGDGASRQGPERDEHGAAQRLGRAGSAAAMGLRLRQASMPHAHSIGSARYGVGGGAAMDSCDVGADATAAVSGAEHSIPSSHAGGGTMNGSSLTNGHSHTSSHAPHADASPFMQGRATSAAAAAAAAPRQPVQSPFHQADAPADNSMRMRMDSATYRSLACMEGGIEADMQYHPLAGGMPAASSTGPTRVPGNRAGITTRGNRSRWDSWQDALSEMGSVSHASMLRYAGSGYGSRSGMAGEEGSEAEGSSSGSSSTDEEEGAHHDPEEGRAAQGWSYPQADAAVLASAAGGNDKPGSGSKHRKRDKHRQPSGSSTMECVGAWQRAGAVLSGISSPWHAPPQRTVSDRLLGAAHSAPAGAGGLGLEVYVHGEGGAHGQGAVHSAQRGAGMTAAGGGDDGGGGGDESWLARRSRWRTKQRTPQALPHVRPQRQGVAPSSLLPSILEHTAPRNTPHLPGPNTSPTAASAEARITQPSEVLIDQAPQPPHSSSHPVVIGCDRPATGSTRGSHDTMTHGSLSEPPARPGPGPIAAAAAGSHSVDALGDKGMHAPARMTGGPEVSSLAATGGLPLSLAAKSTLNSDPANAGTLADAMQLRHAAGSGMSQSVPQNADSGLTVHADAEHAQRTAAMGPKRASLTGISYGTNSSTVGPAPRSTVSFAGEHSAAAEAGLHAWHVAQPARASSPGLSSYAQHAGCSSGTGGMPPAEGCGHGIVAITPPPSSSRASKRHSHSRLSPRPFLYRIKASIRRYFSRVRQLPRTTLLILGLCWGTYLGLQVARGLVVKCGAAYWALFVVQITLMLGAGVGAAVWLRRQINEVRTRSASSNGAAGLASRGGPSRNSCRTGLSGARSDSAVPPTLLPGPPPLPTPTAHSLPGWAVAMTCVAGLIGGLLGLGGGMVMGPLLLEMGLHPQASSATSSLMVLFSSSAAVLQLGLLGRLNVQYAGVFGAASALASLAGVVFVSGAIKRSGHPSIIVLSMAGIMVLGLLIVAIFGTINSIGDFQKARAVPGLNDLCAA